MKSHGQWADKNLDSSEKLLLGGVSAVRGYSSGAGSGDGGVIINLELQHNFPLFYKGNAQWIAFIDSGYLHRHREAWTGWQNGDNSLKNHHSLTAAGLGLNWNQKNWFRLRTTYAQGINLDSATDSRQFWVQLVKSY